MKEISTQYKSPLNIPPLGATYFITIRLKDALPREIIHQLETEFEQEKNQILQDHPDQSEAYTNEAVKRFFAKYDYQLDRQPRGKCYLKHPDVCRIIKDQLYGMDGKYFDLQAHCIMPNHLHFLINIFHYLNDEDYDPAASDTSQTYLNETIEKFKGRTAYYSNQALQRRGNFWQKSSYQHPIRDDAEWCNIVNYIMLNPVRAGLARKSVEYDNCYYKYA